MDINHLLCYPCDPYQKAEYYSSPPQSPPVFSASTSTSSSPLSSPSNYLPPPTILSDVDFWECERSKSIQSTESDNYPYRRRVNSELCRRTDSKSIVFQQRQQQQKQEPIRRRRSNSTSYIQTRTPWTPEEDDLLQKGYEQGLSWAMISCTFLPHRSRGCCWGRFKTLQSKNAIEVYQQRICQRPWKAHTNFNKKKVKKQES
jgi:hypothetical protein